MCFDVLSATKAAFAQLLSNIERLQTDRSKHFITIGFQSSVMGGPAISAKWMLVPLQRSIDSVILHILTLTNIIKPFLFPKVII